MMSHVATHYVLHRHRKTHDDEFSTKTVIDREEAKIGLNARGGLSNKFLGLVGVAVLLSMVFYIVGCVVDVYQVSNKRGEVSYTVDYSIVSVGQAIPASQLEPDDVGTRFLQVMWFFLVVFMPLWCSFLFGLLFFIPSTDAWAKRILFMGEVAFAWSCAEVLVVSTIFSVLQMPTFGDGLIEADCTACFVIDTKILPNFAFFCVGSILSVAVNIWLFRKAHHIIYGGA